MVIYLCFIFTFRYKKHYTRKGENILNTNGNNGRNVLLVCMILLASASSLFGAGSDNFGMAIWNKVVWILADTGIGYIATGWGITEAIRHRMAGETWKAIEYGAIGASLGIFSTVAEQASGALVF